MANILDRIIETKRREVAEAKIRAPLNGLLARLAQLDTPRDFFGAVIRGRRGSEAGRSNRGVHLIAEIKKASPSAGVIRAHFDPVAIARAYDRHGAAALSILTDETYFQGRLEHIGQVKEAVALPVLRKDFIIDEYQLIESRVAGADAILLIVEAIGADRAASLLSEARGLDLEVIIEVHSEENLLAVLDIVGPPGLRRYLLGINNRDLAVQRTDLDTSIRLARLLPPGAPFISESGIRTREDIVAVQKAGACAVLVGESLLREPDVGVKLGELFP